MTGSSATAEFRKAVDGLVQQFRSGVFLLVPVLVCRGSGKTERAAEVYNTAIGFGALALADADGNTATGNLALHSDLIGYDNTATGVSALFSNETGYYNVASGVGALVRAGGHSC